MQLCSARCIHPSRYVGVTCNIIPLMQIMSFYWAPFFAPPACRYVQQGLRAVNQAMGRVIRHRWDYGAVLLADERFGSQQNLRNMSRWLRDQVVQHNNFGAAIASLTKFFKVLRVFV